MSEQPEKKILTFRQEPVKRTVNERLRDEMTMRDEAIGVALKNAAAGLGNEAITRGRLEAYLAMTVWQRLKWLITGRLPVVCERPQEPPPVAPTEPPKTAA